MPDVYKCLFKRFYFAWIGLGWVGLDGRGYFWTEKYR